MYTIICEEGDILTSKHIEPWRVRLNHEFKRFMDGWNWEDVYRTWGIRLGDFGVSVEKLFSELQVHDPHNPIGRDEYLTWCPVDSICEYHLELQRHYDRLPGTFGPLETYIQRKGEQHTLDYLWKFKDQPDKVAAVLIAASLFYRTESTRKRYPDTWPSQYCVRQLAVLALSQFGKARFPWHYSCTKVLPFSSYDWEYTIADIGGLVRFLAEEHAAVLLKYQPLVILFQPGREPSIERQLHIEYEKEKKERKRWKKEWNLKREAERQRKAQLKKEHPRYGEWSSIVAEELKTLVWSMPTVEVARLFGVSDSAVGKRCRTLGVTKPPRGFWAKVQSGNIPHPDGKPQSC